MKSFRDRNPYAVGIVSVLLIGAITGLAFAIGLLHLLEHTYTVHAEFRDAAGLREGDSVRVAGVKVGRVTGIAADRNNGLVDVEFVVNDGVEVHSGAGADIALETLLGAKYIRLHDVMRSEGTDVPLQQLPANDPHRTIRLEKTTTPYDVFELTRRATEGVEGLDTDALNRTINQLADVTDNKQASVKDLIDGLDRVSRAINGRDGELAQLLDRADVLTKTLSDKDQTLVALIDQSKKILDLLANRRDTIATALGQTSQAVSSLSRIIDTSSSQLDSILNTLHPTLETVAANQGHVDDALTWLGPGFYDQALAGSHGPWLDLYIDQLGVPANTAIILCPLLPPGTRGCS